MRNEKDVEAYLSRLNREFSVVEGQNGKARTYLVPTSESFPPIAIRVDPPLVLLRVHIGDIPGPDNTSLLRKLLQLNAKSLVHTSFGLEDDRIVLCSALELENLDFNELEATLDELDLALAQHVPVLAELKKKD
jgi:hypothetical protein